MKICTVCGIPKTEQDFFYQNKHTKKLHAQCKQCYVDKRRNTYKEHYHKYGSEYRARAIERNRRLKAVLRIKLLEYLADKSCVQCGISDPRVLDFDHIDPSTKSFGIARGIHNILKWERLMEEIAKCQILCANCHRIKTAEQQDWFKKSISLI